MPAITGDHPAVVCPADRDNFHWWQGAENLIKKVNQRQSTETSEMEALQAAQAQKHRCQSSFHPIGTLHATSGLRTSMNHWVLDWALIKLDPTRFTFKELPNVSFFLLLLFIH